ncbi:MAG: hypothetical protein U0232_06615 [Thermomicrobiales bacterium]
MGAARGRVVGTKRSGPVVVGIMRGLGRGRGRWRGDDRCAAAPDAGSGRIGIGTRAGGARRPALAAGQPDAARRGWRDGADGKARGGAGATRVTAVSAPSRARMQSTRQSSSGKWP